MRRAIRKIATISPKASIRPDFLAKDEGMEAGCACGENRRASKKVSHLWEGRHRQTENCLAGRPDIDKGSDISFADKGSAAQAKQICKTRISTERKRDVEGKSVARSVEH